MRWWESQMVEQEHVFPENEVEAKPMTTINAWSCKTITTSNDVASGNEVMYSVVKRAANGRTTSVRRRYNNKTASTNNYGFGTKERL